MFHVEHRGELMDKYMAIAIDQAKKAFKAGETPVGAVIVHDGKIISKAHNRKEKSNNPMGHAEILAINKACRNMKDWRLNDCLLFVNLEPCIMCMGLILETRIKKIYCSIYNEKYRESLQKIVDTNNIEIEYGLMEEESKTLLKDFFELKRTK